MKLLYAIAGSIALFVLVTGSLTSYATPRDEVTVSKLRRSPDGWRIEITDESALPNETRGSLKENLVAFLHRAGSPTFTKLDSQSVNLAIVSAFCAIGFAREGYLAKRRNTQDRAVDADA